MLRERHDILDEHQPSGAFGWVRLANARMLGFLRIMPVLEDAHRKAAEDIERTIADLGDPAVKPYISRSLIENYWGAAFHWIAVGCQRKHSKHKENHSHLGKFLRDLGELSVADWWDRLDERRRGGWYGHQTTDADVRTMQGYWQDIKAWATS